MLKWKSHIFLIMILTWAPVSCAWADQAQAYGAVFGALLGGIVGSSVGHGSTQIFTTTTGVLVGGYVGSELGQTRSQPLSPYTTSPGSFNSIGPGDNATALPRDYTPNYVAPPALSPASITPAFNESSKLCRPFPQTLIINNQVFVRTGILCLESDGQWHIAQ